MSRFQILALDGGGWRGIYTAAVIAALEADTRVEFADLFDLIVGTSTGGIIAMGLGAGMRPREIVEFYGEHGPAIFRHSSSWPAVRRLYRSKYNAAALRRAIDGVFGESTLGQSRSRLVIPAYNLDADDVYLFKTPHHPRLRRDWRVPMTDVAMATSAAPTFFPSHKLADIRLVDGGVWANNPVMVGIVEAITMLEVPLGSLRVLSIGTTSAVRRRSRRLDRGGLVQWAASAAEIVMRGQAAGAENEAAHLLGDQIQRINAVLPDGLGLLDRLDPSDLLAAANSTSRVESPRFNELFTDHHPAQYTPFHKENRAHA